MFQTIKNNKNQILKAFTFLILILSVGLPIQKIYWVLFLFFYFLVLLTSPLKKCLNKISFFAIFFIVLLLILIRFLLPSYKIYERHNMFLPKGPITAKSYNLSLPPVLYKFFEQKFYYFYPKEKMCDKNKHGCWRTPIYNEKFNEYTTNPDVVWNIILKKDGAKWSRIVEEINFNSLLSFNGSFFENTDWYSWVSELTRQNMPFFVYYKFSPHFENSTLCLKGDVFIKKEGVFYQYRSAGASYHCSKLDKSIIDGGIWGLCINNDLAMRLIPSNKIKGINQIKVAITIVIFFLFLSLFSINYKRLLHYLLIAIVAVLFLSIITSKITNIPKTSSLYFFENSYINRGGMDGLTYKSYANSMFNSFLKGDIGNVLKGGQSVFYFMPGMPYFKFLSFFIFGENELLGFVSAIFFIFGLYFVLKKILNIFFVIPYFFIFLMSYRCGNFDSWWCFTQYLVLIIIGYGGTLSFAFFLWGLILFYNYLDEKKEKYLIFAPILFSISIFLRPNLVFAVGILYLFFIFLNRKNISIILKWSLSFLPLSLITLHNYCFGKKFVLLTSSAFIPVNYRNPFLYYPIAIWEKVTNSNNLLTYKKVIYHISLWLHNYDFFHIFMIIVFIYSLCNFKKYSTKIQTLIVLCFGLQLPLLFWIPNGRHSFLSWVMMFILFNVNCLKLFEEKFKAISFKKR